MNLNENLLKLISRYESLHDGDLSTIGLQPKMDPVGIWTEGWGHAILDKNNKFVRGIANKKLAYSLSKVKTIEEANDLLVQDMKPIFLIIERKIKVTLNENQVAALASFIYNTGGSDTLFNLINKKSPLIEKWWSEHYITGGGQKLKGLVFRRKSEALLFTTGELKLFY